jgi:hypothetical protein
MGLGGIISGIGSAINGVKNIFGGGNNNNNGGGGQSSRPPVNQPQPVTTIQNPVAQTPATPKSIADSIADAYRQRGGFRFLTKDELSNGAYPMSALATYVVQEAKTLTQIAGELGIDVESLKSVNITLNADTPIPKGYGLKFPIVDAAAPIGGIPGMGNSPGMMPGPMPGMMPGVPMPGQFPGMGGMPGQMPGMMAGMPPGMGFGGHPGMFNLQSLLAQAQQQVSQMLYGAPQMAMQQPGMGFGGMQQPVINNYFMMAQQPQQPMMPQQTHNFFMMPPMQQQASMPAFGAGFGVMPSVSPTQPFQLMPAQQPMAMQQPMMQPSMMMQQPMMQHPMMQQPRMPQITMGFAMVPMGGGGRMWG